MRFRVQSLRRSKRFKGLALSAAYRCIAEVLWSLQATAIWSITVALKFATEIDQVPEQAGHETAQGGFDHVETWVFDLDNTLYPAHCNLFDQVDKRMGSFISQLLDLDLVEAKRLQKSYFYEYGTTLRGLMTCHDINPTDFLDFVHDIDVSVLEANAALGEAIAALEGRKVIFTNGTHAHAENVLGQVGIRDHFEAVFDIADADYIPKPDQEAYDKFVAHVRFDTTKAAMFEDLARNLALPHAMGMTTVLVRSPENESAAFIQKAGGAGDDADHVHHVIEDLTAFLDSIK